jgi:hypothetical protein
MLFGPRPAALLVRGVFAAGGARHGGGFCGGAKHELRACFKLIASSGYVVVAPGHSPAPEHRYPTPPRQMMRAPAFLQTEAERLVIDADRMALAGDSGGARSCAGSPSPAVPTTWGRHVTSARRRTVASCT